MDFLDFVSLSYRLLQKTVLKPAARHVTNLVEEVFGQNKLLGLNLPIYLVGHIIPDLSPVATLASAQSLLHMSDNRLRCFPHYLLAGGFNAQTAAEQLVLILLILHFDHSVLYSQ